MANLLNGDAFGHPTGGNYGIIYPESTLLPIAPTVISRFGLPKYGRGQIDILIFVALLLFGSFKHAKGQVVRTICHSLFYSSLSS